MKTDYIKFLSAASAIRLTGPDRTFAIAAAVASSVADFTDVPATKVDSPSGEYARSAAMMIGDQIACFNEVAPFDLRLALDLARKFWMLRYETIHTRRVHDVNPGDYFCGYFNVNRNFSKSDLECLNRLCVEIGTLEIGIRDILVKCKAKKEAENTKVADENGGAVGMAPMPALA